MKKYKVLVICSLLFFVVSVVVYYIRTNVSILHSYQTDIAFIDYMQEESVKSSHISAVCQTVKSMNFTIKEPHLNITEEEDKLYKEAYLKVLKNEMPIFEWSEQYYKDLWMAGIEFEDLHKRKNDNRFPYLCYYDDLDGDGKPELGINQGCLYLFKYELGESGVRVLYYQQSCYFGKLLGAGQIWYHDGLHAGVIRDRYVLLNEDNEWEEYALDLEQGVSTSGKYYLVGTSLYQRIDVGEEKWNEITKPFFEATEHEIPKKTFEEVFGELLENN